MRLWLATISPSPSRARVSTSSRGRSSSSASCVHALLEALGVRDLLVDELGDLVLDADDRALGALEREVRLAADEVLEAAAGVALEALAQRARARGLGDDDLAAVGLLAQDLALRLRARVPRVGRGEQVAQARARVGRAARAAARRRRRGRAAGRRRPRAAARQPVVEQQRLDVVVALRVDPLLHGVALRRAAGVDFHASISSLTTSTSSRAMPQYRAAEGRASHRPPPLSVPRNLPEIR